MTHAASLLAFLAYARGRFWAGLVPLIIGQQRRTLIISWLLAEASSSGIGRGEMLAMTVNLRAAVETLGPIVYNVAQSHAVRRGPPAQVFYAPAILAVLAEIVRICLSRTKPGAC